MAVKLGDALVYIASNDDKLRAGLNQAEQQTKSKLGGLGGTIAKAVGGAVVGGTLAAGAAIVGLAAQGVNEFIGFQQQMNEVFTLLPGMSQDAMNGMSEDVKRFARDFGVLPEKVVPALYQALSAGVPPDNVFDFLATAQQAAVGGVAELTTSVDGLSSVVNAYGSDVLNVQEASDLMFTAVRLGKTDFNQLSGSLYNVIPTAAALGVEFGDVTAALAAMTAQGTPTSVATTQLRQLFVDLSKSGTKASEAFKELAGKSFQEFIEEGGNVQDALVIMEQAATNNNVSLADMFGSVEAGAAALQLTGRGAETFRANLVEMANASGATQTAFEQMDGGIGKSIEKIRAAWAVTVLDLGTKVAPAFAFLVDKVLEWMPKVSDVTGKVFDVVGNVISTTVAFVQGLLDRFADSVDVSAIGPLEYWRSWIDANLPLVRQLFQNVLGAITTFWENNGESIMRIVTNTFNTAWTIIDTVMRTIGDTVTLVLQVLNGDWEAAGQTLEGIVRRIWDTLSTIVSNQLDSLRTLFTGFDWAAAGRAIVDGVKAGIQAGWNAFVDWFRRKLNELRGMLPFSEPKDSSSPLRGLGKSGAATIENYRAGMEMEMSRLQASLGNGLAGLLGGMQTAPAGMGATNHITVNVYGAGDAQGAGRAAREGVLDALRSRGLR